MNKEEVEQGLDSSGYVHFLVEDVAPLDIPCSASVSRIQHKTSPPL